MSGGRAGRSDCGDHDGVMEQMSGNGAEKSLDSPASVAVSCANVEGLYLYCMIFLYNIIMNHLLSTSFTIHLSSHSDEQN